MRKENRLALKIIKEDELRYRSLFDDSPNSLWEEDFSAIKTHLDALTQQGISDFDEYFTEYPQQLWKTIQLREILDVNKVTLQMYQGSHDKSNLRELGLLFSEESLAEFKKQLLCFISGKTHYHCETVHKTVDGNDIFVSVHVSIVSGYEKTWKKVYTSIVDISDRKEASAESRDGESQ